MDDVDAIVELASYRDICAEEMQRYTTLLNLNDVGIADDPDRCRVFKYNIFRGSQYGTVPVLRVSTRFDRGRGVGLSQVLAKCFGAPVMGETAIVSSLDAQVIENEMQIALTAFRVAAREQFS